MAEIIGFMGEGAIGQVLIQLKKIVEDQDQKNFYFGIGFKDSESNEWVFAKDPSVDYLRGAFEKEKSNVAMGYVGSISETNHDSQFYMSLSGKTIILFDGFINKEVCASLASENFLIGVLENSPTVVIGELLDYYANNLIGTKGQAVQKILDTIFLKDEKSQISLIAIFPGSEGGGSIFLANQKMPLSFAQYNGNTYIASSSEAWKDCVYCEFKIVPNNSVWELKKQKDSRP